jgi:hypothetical protein
MLLDRFTTTLMGYQHPEASTPRKVRQAGKQAGRQAGTWVGSSYIFLTPTSVSSSSPISLPTQCRTCRLLAVRTFPSFKSVSSNASFMAFQCQLHALCVSLH